MNRIIGTFTLDKVTLEKSDFKYFLEKGDVKEEIDFNKYYLCDDGIKNHGYIFKILEIDIRGWDSFRLRINNIYARNGKVLQENSKEGILVYYNQIGISHIYPTDMKCLLDIMLYKT